MLELFVKGGPIMWPLLLVSIAGLGVTFERVLFIVRKQRSTKRAELDRLLAAVRQGRLKDATQLATDSRDALVSILGYGLAQRESSFEDAVSHAAEIELESYRRGTSLLDTIITLAPLLGLLGTVTGMIQAFGLLGGSELDAPAAITGGIAEALIATAYGLGIAILCLLPFNYINNEREKFQRLIERSATELELALKQQPVQPIQRAA